MGTFIVILGLVFLLASLVNILKTQREKREDVLAAQTSLDAQIALYVSRGYQMTVRDGMSAQMLKRKHFSLFWGLAWFLFFGVGIVVYLIYYASKRDALTYLSWAGNVAPQWQQLPPPGYYPPQYPPMLPPGQMTQQQWAQQPQYNPYPPQHPSQYNPYPPQQPPMPQPPTNQWRDPSEQPEQRYFDASGREIVPPTRKRLPPPGVSTGE